MSRKFLIGQLGAFGDCLYATAIAKQIKHDYPDSHITWAVSSKCKSILLLNAYVDAVWEITDEKRDYFMSAWKTFEKEAEKRKKKGDFDEIVYSQILPKNFYKYNGTIRSSILSMYPRPITVDVSPEICLSAHEVDNVRKFAEKNNFLTYKHVVLFECEPTSAQSKIININFAINIARECTAQRKDICFIISSYKKLSFFHPQIIDASELSFRENAELTHYCTLLIGCSSGITWLATSSWAKKGLPNLQLLDATYGLFAGIHYDFEMWHLDNSKIVERLNFDAALVIKMINVYAEEGIEVVKQNYHEVYKPGYIYCSTMINYGLHYYRLVKTIQFVINQRNNTHHLKTTKIISIFFKQIMIVFREKSWSFAYKIYLKFKKKTK